MKIQLAACSVLLVSAVALKQAEAQPPKQELQQKLAALKESVGRNQAALRQYSWTEHTDIILKGEVKKTEDKLCRYGPDGQVQKTPLGTPAAPKQMRGMKKRMVDKKVGELTDYMDRAAALIHRYVPPSPQRMQGVFEAGGAAVAQAGPGLVSLQFHNYVKPGDSLVLSLNAGPKQLNKVAVNSYLDSPQDAVTLDVNFYQLPDGTNYTSSTLLNAPAKDVQVRVTNSNHQRLAH